MNALHPISQPISAGNDGIWKSGQQMLKFSHGDTGREPTSSHIILLNYLPEKALHFTFPLPKCKATVFIRGDSDALESASNAGDLGLIIGSGRSPGEGNGYPLQYSCLEKPMDRGAWWATVHGVTKSWTRLGD